MISGRETMTSTGNRACAMKLVTFLLVVPFKCCSKLFLHLNNIHGLHNGHYVHLVFMLLPRKSESINHSMCSAIDLNVENVIQPLNLYVPPFT